MMVVCINRGYKIDGTEPKQRDNLFMKNVHIVQQLYSKGTT